MALEELKTVEDVIKTLEIYKNTSTGKNVLIELIDVLAQEVNTLKQKIEKYAAIESNLETLKKEVGKQRLLIEHEERLRVSGRYKEKRKTERNVPRKFKRGDVVCRIKDTNKSGQIITVKNDRARVLFDETPCWVALSKLTYYQVAA